MDGKMIANYNAKHLAKADNPPELSSVKATVFSMRFCPFGQRAVLAAVAKGIE